MLKDTKRSLHVIKKIRGILL